MRIVFILLGCALVVSAPYWLFWPQSAIPLGDAADSNIPYHVWKGALLAHGEIPLWHGVKMAGSDQLAQEGSLNLADLLFAALPTTFAYPLHELLYLLSAMGFAYLLLRRRIRCEPLLAIGLAGAYGVLVSGLNNLYYNDFFAVLPAAAGLLAALSERLADGAVSTRRAALLSLLGGLVFGALFVSPTTTLVPGYWFLLLYLFVFERQYHRHAITVFALFCGASVLPMLPHLISLLNNLPLSSRAAHEAQGETISLLGHMAQNQWSALIAALISNLKFGYWNTLSFIQELPRFAVKSRPLLSQEALTTFGALLTGGMLAGMAGGAYRMRGWRRLRRPVMDSVFLFLVVAPLLFSALVLYLFPLHALSAFRFLRFLFPFNLALIVVAGRHLSRALDDPPEARGVTRLAWARRGFVAALALVALWGGAERYAIKEFKQSAAYGTMQEILDNPSLRRFFDAANAQARQPYRVEAFPLLLHPAFVNSLGMETFGGYSAMHTARFNDYWAQTTRALNSPQADFIHGVHKSYLYPIMGLDALWRRASFQPLKPYALAHSANAILLGLGNVRYVLSRYPLSDPHLQLRETTPYLQPPTPGRAWLANRLLDFDLPRLETLYIYALDTFQPRFRGVFAQRTYATQENVLTALGHAPEKMLQEVALLKAGDAPADLKLESGAVANVTVLRYSPNRIELDLEFSGAGILLAAQAFHPGWRGRLDGAPVALFPVDHLFTGAAIPAGRHRLTLTYRPLGL
ncbi:DUF6044 family protein [Magnetofaba australis]|uniref:Putative membrane YfhO n=1 Tax=Magnetofaba australis IT-1 TaxID=1434232 RepID=A0A1Y2K8I8_9PROT|nr:DUF6044 family protein [Magnetofaba australis]OSM06817.1 putative membrane YfhO [Magnetofaba australis IT-1]